MNSLLELPMKVAGFVARTSMRLAETAAARLRAARAPEARTPEPEPEPKPKPRSGPQPRPSGAPRAPRPDATPPAAPDVPDEPPITVVPKLTHGQAARIREDQREAEATDDSPGAEVHVDEPWPGYAVMKAPEIIDRLRVSDDAVKAVVLLYEGSHRARKTVLRAAGG